MNDVDDTIEDVITAINLLRDFRNIPQEVVESEKLSYLFSCDEATLDTVIATIRYIQGKK